jgi:hypothetical protein
VTRAALKLLLAFTLFALALPSAVLARKSAWQLVSLSGTYAYHATNTAPAGCDPNNNFTGDGTVLSRDYTETFRADSFPSYQYAAKYFPSLGAPVTNAQGQKSHLVRQGTLSESYRTFTVADGACSSQDQTCTKAQNSRSARFIFGVSQEPRFGFGRPIHIRWDLDGLSNAIGDCTPHSDTLERGLLPFNPVEDIPSLFKSKASKRQFAHRRASFSVHGTAKVRKTQGYTATVTYSAKATVKKVVIPDGCVDTHPQHTFVCSN